MRKVLILFTMLSLFLALNVKMAKAGDGPAPPPPNDEVEQLKKVIEDLKSRVNELEDKKVEVLPNNLTLEHIEKAKWAEKIRFNGDFRYRHEYIDNKVQSNGQTTRLTPRNRHRIRARIGMEATINDDLDAIMRIATGEESGTVAGGDPRSTNQTLSNAFSKKDIWLDLAYIDYHPKSFANLNTDGLHLYAGKMKDPIYHAGGSQLIIEETITPEGGAMSYKTDLGIIKPFANIGGFWVQERANDVDSSLWVFQGGASGKIGSILELTSGLSFYNFNSIEGQQVFYNNTNSNGNTAMANPPITATSVKTYEKDYNIINPFVEGKFNVMDLPVSVFGDFARNATKNDSFGALVGFTLNKCDKPGSWMFGYDYRDVEPDAVVGAFAEANFADGRTGGRGHKFRFKYQLAKNIDVGSTLYLCKIDVHQQFNDRIVNRTDLTSPASVNRWEDYKRLQFDLNVKF